MTRRRMKLHEAAMFVGSDGSIIINALGLAAIQDPAEILDLAGRNGWTIVLGIVVEGGLLDPPCPRSTISLVTWPAASARTFRAGDGAAADDHHVFGFPRRRPGALFPSPFGTNSILTSTPRARARRQSVRSVTFWPPSIRWRSRGAV